MDITLLRVLITLFVSTHEPPSITVLISLLGPLSRSSD